MVDVAEPPVKRVWEPLWMWVDEARPLERTSCTPPVNRRVALANPPEETNWNAPESSVA
jgi:hypothetical protein